MSIDGTGAPEGATHYGADTDSHVESWYRVESGKITSFVCVGDHPLVLSDASAGSGFYHAIDELVEIWTGNGIPPVGAVCEGLNGSNQWVRCMVLHHTLHIPPKALAVYGELEDGLASFYSWRPIRTPEQIAAEEIEVILDWMVNLDSERGLRGIAEDLHADGYRKKVKP